MKKLLITSALVLSAMILTQDLKAAAESEEITEINITAPESEAKEMEKVDKDIEKADKEMEKADKEMEKADKEMEKAGEDIEKADKEMDEAE